MAVSGSAIGRESLVKTLLDRVEANPARVLYRFVSDDGKTHDVTFGDLDYRARKIANALQGLSSQPRIAMLLHSTGPSFISSFFGCLYAGVIAIPAATQSLRGDGVGLRSLLGDSGVKVILTTSSLRQKIRNRAKLHKTKVQLLVDEDCDAPGSAEVCMPKSNDVAYIQYTSGSTSTPRGVMITHHNLLSNLQYIDEDFRHDESSISVTWLPHYHDMGLVYGLLQPIVNNFLGIVLSPSQFAKSPIAWLQAISHNKATHSGGPNFAYDWCVKKIASEGYSNMDLSSWRVAFNGAEPVRLETMLRFAEAFGASGFRRCAFYPAFGLAEATLKVSGGFLQDSACRDVDCESLRKHVAIAGDAAKQQQMLVSCGRPRQNVRVVVVDSETRKELPPGQIGEIWVSGPGVGRGYWNAEAETERVFRASLAENKAGMFLRTGDLGTIVDGELFVTGRLKDLIIVRGENHYPQDIENTVATVVPALWRVISAAFSAKIHGTEEPFMIVEAPPLMKAEFSALASDMRLAVAEKHGIPLHTIAFVPAGTLPMTSSGKIQRGRAREEYLGGRMQVIYQSSLSKDAAIALVSKDTEMLIERRLLAMASEVLNKQLSTSELDIPLTALGLDSLQAEDLRGRIEVEFGHSISLEQVLSGASIGTLTRELESRARVQTKETVTNQEAVKRAGALSPEQERLWFFWLLAPKSSAHNLVLAFRLKGRFNLRRWEMAIAETERRHDSLRSSFYQVEGIPYRHIHPPGRQCLQFLDLSNIPEELREDAARREIDLKVHEPFDLENSPMLRALVIRLTADEHIAAFATHHIISDVWSFRILLRDISECYQASSAEEIVAEQASQGSYDKYVKQTRQWLESAAAVQDREFWLGRLKEANGFVALPLDHPRHTGANNKAAEIILTGRKSLISSLEQLTKQEGVTTFVIMLSAFYVLLNGITKQSDLIVGVPVANRAQQEYRNVIGFFAHPIPLRLTVSEQDTFQKLLGRVRTELLQALNHQRFPFGKVVEVTAPKRLFTRTPFINVMFGYHRSTLEECAITGLAVERYETPRRNTDFDLVFDIDYSIDELRLSLTYASELFDPETARTIGSAYLLLLDQLIAEPVMPVSEALSRSLPLRQSNAAEVSSGPVKIDVVIASSFAAETMKEILEWWQRQLNLPVAIKFTNPSELVQELVDPGRTLKRNGSGSNVILLRAKDLEHDPRFIETLARFLEEQLRDAHKGNTFVYLCPACRDTGESDSFEYKVSQRLKSIDGIELIDSTQLNALYPVDEQFDLMGDRIANLPYSLEFFAALGTHFVRKIVARQRKPVKVIAVDCDETLWCGACGEISPENVEVTGDHRALQSFLREQQQKGVLLCLCSKNNRDDVCQVFRSSKDMLLTECDFVASRINWRPKSENLRELASELGLSLDTFVLLDDDPRECAEVEQNAPTVASLLLPRKRSQFLTFLQHCWALDQQIVTNEGRQRTLFYQQNSERAEEQQQHCDRESFIDSLDIEIRFLDINDDNLARAAELTHRTTQFNTSGVRYNTGQLQAALAGKQLTGVLAEVKDRFGPYGIVGILLLSVGSGGPTLDLLALSCRALGRGVEERMLQEALRLISQWGFSQLVVTFKRTERNVPAYQFLEEVVEPGGKIGSSADNVVYILKGSQLIKRSPQVLQGRTQAPLAPLQDSSASSERTHCAITSQKLNWIATNLSTAADVVREWQADTQIKRPDSLPKATPPSSPTELALTAIWKEVLNIDQIGRFDDFFEIGGHSLSAVRILSRMQEKFNVELGLELFFDGPTTIARTSKIVDEALERQNMQQQASA